MTSPNINTKMPVRGGYESRERDNYVHGGPAGSELGPVLNGVECCMCGEPLGKRYRMFLKGGPICYDLKACVVRCKANAAQRAAEEAEAQC